MKIQDLVPRKSKINLKMIIDGVEQDRQYILMPATIKTILDLSKILERNIEDIFTNPSAEEIAKISFFLMEDKKDFLVREVSFVDMNGNEVKERIGGYVLLMNLFRNVDDLFSVFASILECFGYDQEQVDEIKNEKIDDINDSIEKNIDKKKELIKE